MTKESTPNPDTIHNKTERTRNKESLSIGWGLSSKTHFIRFTHQIQPNQTKVYINLSIEGNARYMYVCSSG
jgi:hypothetical protein